MNIKIEPLKLMSIAKAAELYAHRAGMDFEEDAAQLFKQIASVIWDSDAELWIIEKPF